MSATFHTSPTPCHESRPAHPSLLPPPRPALVGVGEGPPVGTRRRLPGGAILVERRPGPAVAELLLFGEIDVFDRGAVIDACTAAILEGARHVRIDGGGIEFVDLRILETLAKIALRCHRIGGSFELTGLREPFSGMWERINPHTRSDGAQRGRLDDRVVPLRSPESVEATRKATPTAPQASAPVPALRIVPEPEMDGAASASRPA